MQINALRKELAALLNSRPTGRTPALRRSRKDEWLYATDAAALLLPEEREKLGSAAKDRIREAYSWRFIGEEYRSVWRR